MPNEFRCQKCGYCCKNITINVSYSDIIRWLQEKRYDILDKISYLDNEEVGKGFYIEETLRKKDRKNLPCPFLKNNLCSIYETRPRACVDFPDGHSTWKECPAWRKIGFAFDEIKDAIAKRSQREDFALAWEKRFLLLHFLTLARARDSETIERLLDPLDPDETLWVTTYDATSQWETTSGSSPWLDDSDSYIESAVKKADSRNYGFANTSQSANTLTGVSLYMQGQDATGTVSEAFLFDGVDWVGVPFNLDFDATLGYKSVDVFSWINTWAKVDACQLWFRHENDTVTTRAYRAYLFCTYTTEGLSQQCDETITVSEVDYKKPSTLYTESTTMNEVVSKGIGTLRKTILDIFDAPFSYSKYAALTQNIFQAITHLSFLTPFNITKYLYQSSNLTSERSSYLSTPRYSTLTFFEEIGSLLYKLWTLDKSEPMSLTDLSFLNIGKWSMNGLNLVHYLSSKAGIKLDQDTSLSTFLTYLMDWKRLPSLALDITDYWSYQISGMLFKAIEQSMDLLDYIFHQSDWKALWSLILDIQDFWSYEKYGLLEELITQAMSLIDITPRFQYNLKSQEAFDIVSFLSSLIGKSLSGSLSLLDSILKKLETRIERVLNLQATPLLSTQFSRALLEPVGFYDYLITNFMPAFQEIVKRLIRLKFIEAD